MIVAIGASLKAIGMKPIGDTQKVFTMVMLLIIVMIIIIIIRLIIIVLIMIIIVVIIVVIMISIAARGEWLTCVARRPAPPRRVARRGRSGWKDAGENGARDTVLCCTSHAVLYSTLLYHAIL